MDVVVYPCVCLLDTLQSDKIKHKEPDNGAFHFVDVCVCVCESSCDCCKWVAGGSLRRGKHLRHRFFIFSFT